MTVLRKVVTWAQGVVTSQFHSFISVHLSWVRRRNVGMYKATDNPGFMVYAVVVFMELCFARTFFRRCLHVVYARNQR